jgi:phosphoribosylformylglycinamidine synthase
VFAAVHKAIEERLVRSCHDLSEGGLATAAAEMAFAGGLGADLDLTKIGSIDLAVALFSESTTRFLVEVEPDAISRFEAVFAGLPLARVGVVTDRSQLKCVVGSETLLDQDCRELKSAWQKPLAWE